MSDTMLAPGRRSTAGAGDARALRVVRGREVPPATAEYARPPAAPARPADLARSAEPARLAPSRVAAPGGAAPARPAEPVRLAERARQAAAAATTERAAAMARHPAGSARRPDQPVPLRLTRRGRLVVVLIVSVVLCVAFSLGRVTSSASSGTSAPHRTVVVRTGDTLWSIARRAAPDKDTRVVVEQISRLNRLGDGPVQAGTQLRLP